MYTCTHSKEWRTFSITGRQIVKIHQNRSNGWLTLQLYQCKVIIGCPSIVVRVKHRFRIEWFVHCSQLYIVHQSGSLLMMHPIHNELQLVQTQVWLKLHHNPPRITIPCSTSEPWVHIIQPHIGLHTNHHSLHFRVCYTIHHSYVCSKDKCEMNNGRFIKKIVKIFRERGKKLTHYHW